MSYKEVDSTVEYNTLYAEFNKEELDKQIASISTGGVSAEDLKAIDELMKPKFYDLDENGVFTGVEQNIDLDGETTVLDSDSDDEDDDFSGISEGLGEYNELLDNE